MTTKKKGAPKKAGHTRAEIAAARDRAQESFIEAYSRTGHNGHAAKKAGVHWCTPHQWGEDSRKAAKANDARAEGEPDRRPPEGWFHERWLKARGIAYVGLEDEAVRRAKRGVAEPVFWKGMTVGYVQRYSDGLLQFLMKHNMPETYRDKQTLEVSGPNGKPIEHKVGLTDERAAELRAKFLGVHIVDPKSTPPTEGP